MEEINGVFNYTTLLLCFIDTKLESNTELNILYIWWQSVRVYSKGEYRTVVKGHLKHQD